MTRSTPLAAEALVCLVRARQCLALARAYAHCPDTALIFRRFAREWLAEGRAHRPRTQ